MLQVSISEKVANECPDLCILVLTCKVKNTESDEQCYKEAFRPGYRPDL